MSNIRHRTAETALEVVEIINKEVGVLPTAGVQDARLTLMSPTCSTESLEDICTGILNRKWSTIMAQWHTVPLRMVDCMLDAIQIALQDSLNFVASLDKSNDLLEAWMDHFIDGKRHTSIDPLWRTLTPYVRYLKHRDMMMGKTLAYLQDVKSVDSDHTHAHQMLTSAHEELVKIRAVLTDSFVNSNKLVQLLEKSPYCALYKVAALMSPYPTVDHFLSVEYGKPLSNDNFLELEKFFCSTYFDCSHIQKTPWSDLPDWVITILAKTDNVFALSVVYFDCISKWSSNFGLSNRILDCYHVLPTENADNALWAVDHHKLLNALAEDELSCFVNINTRFSVLSDWIKTGKKVVEITPNSHETLFNVCANRVDNDLSPVRFEDEPLPGDKYFKETVCFKFTNVFCSRVAYLENIARDKLWKQEYDWLECINQQTRRYLSDGEQSKWPQEKTRPYPLSKNFRFPLIQDPDQVYYVFVSSESMILDEKIRVSIAGRSSRPLWCVARNFDWRLCEKDLQNPFNTFDEITPSDSEEDFLNSPFVKINWKLGGLSISDSAYSQHRGSVVQMLHDSWIASAREHFDIDLSDIGLNAEDPECIFGNRPKQNWILIDQVSELGPIAANALAAMNKDVKVTFSQHGSRKARKGTRGSRSRRSKTLRLDEKGLRTYSKSVRRTPPRDSQGNRRGTKIGIQNVDGHSYRVWVVSPRHGETVLGRRERTGKAAGFLYCVKRREGVRGTGYVRGEGITVNPYRLKRGIDDLGLPTG